MAHFLIVTQPFHGHVNPVIPIGRTLVERGHEVMWMTGRALRNKVEDAGMHFFPYPEAFDPGKTPPYEFWPEMAKLKGFSHFKWSMKHVFLDSAPYLNQAIQEVANRHRIDALVADAPSFGAYYASVITGIPSAMISMFPLLVASKDTAPGGLGLLPGKGVIAKLRNRCLNYLGVHVFGRDVAIHENKIRRQLGLAPIQGNPSRSVYDLSSLVIQLSTPAFEYPRSDQPEHLHFVGPALLGRLDGFSPPVWWQELAVDRPVILVNQGTFNTNPEELIRPAIEAFRHEDVLVVAVPVAEGALQSTPENVRAEKFIPFDDLLPHVDLMVTNGGYGGTQIALAHGVPLVVAGATEDKMEVAARVEWSGAGINLGRKRPSPSSIKKAVKKVLSTSTYRENAQRIQRDFAQYDAPKRAAELLEQLAERKGEFARDKA